MSPELTITLSLLTGLGVMVCVLLWAICGRLGRLLRTLERLAEWTREDTR